MNITSCYNGYTNLNFDFNAKRTYNSNYKWCNLKTFQGKGNLIMSKQTDIDAIKTALETKYKNIESSPVSDIKSLIIDFVDNKINCEEFMHKYRNVMTTANAFLSNIPEKDLNMNIKNFSNEFDLSNRIYLSFSNAKQNTDSMMEILKKNITDN